MTERVHYNPNLIFSVGTQVVTLVDIAGSAGLVGIYLMQTGLVEANLLRLNETAKLPYLDDLIQRKIAGAEKERLTEADLNFHRSEYGRLRSKLQEAYGASALPEAPCGGEALHELLVRVRLSA